jgi:hypothetical protein
MARKTADWICTGVMAAMSLFAGFAYLPGNPQAVEAHGCSGGDGLDQKAGRKTVTFHSASEPLTVSRSGTG